MKYLNKFVSVVFIIMLLSATVSATLVGDYVWYDTNCDGIQDAKESGLAGVKNQLYNSAGTLLKESPTLTDGTGFYKFSVPDYGSYYVIFLPPTVKYFRFMYSDVKFFRLPVIRIG